MSTRSLDELCAMLASPDPAVRDGMAYDQLVERIETGALDGRLRELGDRMVATLTHPEVQARTFATLGLCWAILRDTTTGELTREDVLRWRDAFAQWYLAETDLRGYDDGLGWLHAVAHGADTIEALGRSGHLDAAGLGALLDVVRRRLVTPTDYLFAGGEDDRIANAVAAVLFRPELDVATATGWLGDIRTALADAPAGPPPIWRANTIATLNAIYVAVARGVQLYVGPDAEGPLAVAPHREAILDAVAATLRVPNAYLG